MKKWLSVCFLCLPFIVNQAGCISWHSQTTLFKTPNSLSGVIQSTQEVLINAQGQSLTNHSGQLLTK